MGISDQLSRLVTRVTGRTLGIGLIFLAFFGSLYLSSLYSYLLFHTLAELFSIIIAGAVFALAWTFRRFYKNSFLLFIGTAYLFCSIIDLVHTLAYKGMNIFTGYDANLPTQLWIAARYMQAISLLMAPLFLRRKVRMRWLLGGFALVTGLLLLVIFTGFFPTCFVEGTGLTPFKIASEYVIDGLLAASIVVLLRSRRSLDRTVLRWMILSIAVTMVSELAFTFYVSVYGLSNLVGHLGKIIVYYLFFKAVIETETGAIFADMTKLRETEQALRASELKAQHSLAELRGIYAHTPVGLCFYDTGLRYQAINEMLASVNGLTADAHIGKTIHEILPEFIARPIEDSVRRVLESGQPVLDQELCGMMDTSDHLQPERHWLVSYHPVFNPDGSVLGVSCVVQDVTEHRRAEAALHESEKQLRTLGDHLPEGAIYRYRQDCDGKPQFEFISAGIEEITGVPVEEILRDASALHKTILLEDYQRKVAEEERSSANLTPFEMETRQRHRVTGEIRWSLLRSLPSRHPDGSTVWDGIQLDITERKRVEERTRRQNALLTGINRIFREALTCQTEEELGEICLAVAEQVTNSQFGFIGRLNQQTGQMDDIAMSDPGWEACRLPEPKGHGLKLTSGLPVEGIYGRVLRDGQGFYTNDPLNHPDRVGLPEGHPPLLAFLGVPLLYDSRTIGMVALGNRPGGYEAEDLQAMQVLAPAIVQVMMNKRADNALRESEKRFRSVVEANMIGVVFADPDTGAVTDANDEYLRIIGCTREQIEAGQINWRDITPPELLEQEQEDRFNQPSGMRRSPYEKEYLRPDGSRVPVIVGGSYLDDDCRMVVAFVLDNTERKRMTEALAQANIALQEYAEKLKRSNQELEQFAFVASHDLQEPLRKIKMFGSRLEESMGADLDEGAKDYLNRMNSASERMAVMIDGLLELARINTRGGNFEPTHLNGLVEDVLTDLEARIQSSGGQVTLGELYSAEVDVPQARRLFQNLIGNALKFHRPGLPPLVELSGTITRAANASSITICVKDNGIGFEEQYAERIFQPFQRLHGRTEYEGTGLGLSICQKIVERHNGKIEAHSTPGSGAVFLITLPIRQAGE